MGQDDKTTERIGRIKGRIPMRRCASIVFAITLKEEKAFRIIYGHPQVMAFVIFIFLLIEKELYALFAQLYHLPLLYLFSIH